MKRLKIERMRITVRMQESIEYMNNTNLYITNEKNFSSIHLNSLGNDFTATFFSVPQHDLPRRDSSFE